MKEIKQMKKLADEFFKKADNFIKKEKVNIGTEKDLLEIRQNSEPDSWNTLKGEHIN